MAGIDRHAVNALSYVIMVEMLLKRPCTLRELIEESGFSSRSVSRFLRLLRRRKHTCYVAKWGPDALGRMVVPSFRLGDKLDVPKPRRKTATERSAARRLRQQVRKEDEVLFRGSQRRSVGEHLGQYLEGGQRRQDQLHGEARGEAQADLGGRSGRADEQS